MTYNLNTSRDLIYYNGNIFTTISFCIESIWDKETVYASKDHTKEEINEFLESLPDASFQKIQKFFDTVPVLKHTFDIKCTAQFDF